MQYNIIIIQYKQRSKYEILSQTHHFVLAVVETGGAFDTEALDLFAEIGMWICTATQEIRAQAFLLQQVSVALQRGNAASVHVGLLDSFPIHAGLTFSVRP